MANKRHQSCPNYLHPNLPKYLEETRLNSKTSARMRERKKGEKVRMVINNENIKMMLEKTVKELGNNSPTLESERTQTIEGHTTTKGFERTCRNPCIDIEDEDLCANCQSPPSLCRRKPKT
ncbi:hypothetical protein ACTXT7_004049 [Hymenolepis weldensis]